MAMTDETNAPEHIAKMCLGHVVGNEVDRSYRRTDNLDQRRELMAMWADFVTGVDTQNLKLNDDF